MVDKLAGRLTWEQLANGIRVEIPARRNWVLAFLLVWLAGWSVAGWKVLMQTLSQGSPQHYAAFGLLWLAAWALGEFFVAATIIWSLLGSTTVVLEPSTLAIIERLGGYPIRSRSFGTSHVRNLRFVPAINRRQSALCFQSGHKTIRFASQIGDTEAAALIDKMLEVHPFPKKRT